MKWVVVLWVAAAVGCAADLENEPLDECQGGLCDEADSDPDVGTGEPICKAQVRGVGEVDVEHDYVPRVLACLNFGAPLEMQRIQAIVVRSYLYERLAYGPIEDGALDLVYTCDNEPEDVHRQAALDTAGEVLKYGDVTVRGYFAFGAIPSDRETCIPVDGDDDLLDTEQYITYNAGLSGPDVEPSAFSPRSPVNRGTFSINGARCRTDRGDSRESIIAAFYGTDTLITNVGRCD